MHSIEQFLALSQDSDLQGWPVVGKPKLGAIISYFGQVLNYQLQTPDGVEDYTSLLRYFGWAVVFGVTPCSDKKVITLAQWKPGVNAVSWELPPGGIGKISSGATILEIAMATKKAYLRETGMTTQNFHHLGHIMIETGKYRGASPDDHGLMAHLFLAQDLVEVQDARQPAPNEQMRTLPVPIEEFRAVLESGLFVEESAVACAYKALENLGCLQWTI